MWQMLIEWLKTHMMTCPSKHFFHIDCLGCGMQRSFISLLEGNISECIALYPATIPLLTLLIYTGLHLFFDFKHGAALIKWGYICCAAIILIFYIYKILTFKVFTL